MEVCSASGDAMIVFHDAMIVFHDAMIVFHDAMMLSCNLSGTKSLIVDCVWIRHYPYRSLDQKGVPGIRLLLWFRFDPTCLNDNFVFISPGELHVIQ